MCTLVSCHVDNTGVCTLIMHMLSTLRSEHFIWAHGVYNILDTSSCLSSYCGGYVLSCHANLLVPSRHVLDAS